MLPTEQTAAHGLRAVNCCLGFAGKPDPVTIQALGEENEASIFKPVDRSILKKKKKRRETKTCKQLNVTIIKISLVSNMYTLVAKKVWFFST